MRFFISQEVLDGLVEKEQASVQDDVLAIPERGLRAKVEPAVFFLREVEGKADPNDLVGKVKTVEAIVGRGADLFRASVILGDVAYDVVEGYLGLAEDGWAWPGRAEVQPAAAVPAEPAAAPEPEPVAPSGGFDVVMSDGPGGTSGGGFDLRTSVVPPPPDGDANGIIVDVVGGDEALLHASAPSAGSNEVIRRVPLDPERLALIKSKPGFHQASVPDPDSDDRPAGPPRPPRRPSRPPPGLSRLPAPAPGTGARTSRPPLPPGVPRRPSAPPPEDVPASPGKAADELEKILLETIRPTRRKRP